MRIIHVSFFDDAGGAAIAARRLMEAQRAAGLDARMLVIRKTRADPVISTPLGRIGSGRIRVTRFFCRRFAQLAARNDPDAMRTIGLIPSGMGRAIGGERAHVIHLHWLGNEMISLAELASIPQPFVWTCHDMWPFTGAQHYPADTCFIDGYDTGFTLDVDRWTFRRKKQAWSGWRPTLICPSAWMAEQAAASRLMRHAESVVIPNTLDMTVFKPTPREDARRRLALPTDKKLILFGADRGAADPRKGFDLIRDALALLPKNVDIAVFGGSTPDEIAGRRPHAFGTVRDETLLATLYSAADVFVAPSRMDNLPNTLLEAQSCAVPCVGFNVGGLREIISNASQGALAAPFDVSDLAAKIADVLDDRIAADRDAIRKSAAARYSPKTIVAQHLTVYRRVTGARSPQAACLQPI